MSDRKIFNVYASTTVITFLVCGLYLFLNGSSDDNIRLLLRLTAQAAFIALIIILVSRPLRQLFKSVFTQKLVKNRALTGAIFAAIFTGHLMLLFYRALMVTTFSIDFSKNLSGILIFIVMYAMLITTFSKPKQFIGAKAWRFLHKGGIYFITYGFMIGLLPSSLDKLSEMNWGIFTVFIAVVLIRVAAFIKSRHTT